MSNLIHPRLIALDLDGTLLDRQGAVTPRTRQAIADAVAQGRGAARHGPPAVQSAAGGGQAPPASATLSPPTEPQSGTSARTP